MATEFQTTIWVTVVRFTYLLRHRRKTFEAIEMDARHIGTTHVNGVTPADGYTKQAWLSARGARTLRNRKLVETHAKLWFIHNECMHRSFRHNVSILHHSGGAHPA